MSVSSEFRRSLRGCVDALRECDGPDAAGLAAELKSVSRENAADLSRSATRALEVLETAPAAFGPGPAPQLQEFERRREHLEAICRVILGH